MGGLIEQPRLSEGSLTEFDDGGDTTSEQLAYCTIERNDPATNNNNTEAKCWPILYPHGLGLWHITPY